MSYDNQMLKFNFIALQGFGQISAPVADSALSTQPHVLLCFRMGTGGFAVATEHAFRRPCFRANKGSSSLPCACAADFSHNDDSHYTHASHQVQQQSNLFFFSLSPCCCCFHDNTGPQRQLKSMINTKSRKWIWLILLLPTGPVSRLIATLRRTGPDHRLIMGLFLPFFPKFGFPLTVRFSGNP